MLDQQTGALGVRGKGTVKQATQRQQTIGKRLKRVASDYTTTAPSVPLGEEAHDLDQDDLPLPNAPNAPMADPRSTPVEAEAVPVEVAASEAAILAHQWATAHALTEASARRAQGKRRLLEIGVTLRGARIHADREVWGIVMEGDDQ